MTSSRINVDNFINVGVLIVLLVGLAAFAVGPYYKYHQFKQAHEANGAALGKLDLELSSAGKLKEENLQLIAIGQDASLLLDGETTGIAGANLQRLMSALIVENKGTPTTSQIIAPKSEDDLVRISMSLSLTINTDGLRDLLHSIETRSPLIFIDELNVSSADAETWSSPDPNFMGPLEVTLLVSGYTLKGKAPTL